MKTVVNGWRAPGERDVQIKDLCDKLNFALDKVVELRAVNQANKKTIRKLRRQIEALKEPFYAAATVANDLNRTKT